MSKFTIFGQSVEFSEAQDRFMELAQMIPSLKEDAKEYFQKVYDERWFDIEDVLDEYDVAATSLVEHLLKDKLYSYLIDADIYDISEEAMIDKCFDTSCAAEAYNAVANVYNKIVEEYEDEVEYRQLRKASRNRVVGGGFGFSGAIKGMAMAGAMNATTGIGHSIANAFGNLKSSIDAENAKDDLFENEATYEVLELGVLNSIIDTINTFVIFINDYKTNEGEDVWIDSSPFDINRAETLLSNAVKFKEKRKELLFKAFAFCPYHPDILKAIFVAYESERQNIVSISDILHLDLSDIFEKVINTMYPDNADSNDENNSYSEEELINIRAKIVAFMSEFNVEDSETLTQLEEDIINMIAEEYTNLDFDHRESVVAKIITCDISDDVKKQCIYDYDIWELFERYFVTLPAGEKGVLITKAYEDICSIHGISPTTIIHYLEKVINAVDIKDQSGAIAYDVREVLFESLTGILSEKFKAEEEIHKLTEELDSNIAEKASQIIRNANVDFLTTSLRYRKSNEHLDTSNLKYCTIAADETPFIIYDERPWMYPGSYGFCLTDKRLVGKPEYDGKYEIPINQIIGFEKKSFLSNKFVVTTKNSTREINVENLSSIGSFVDCLNQILTIIPNNQKAINNRERLLNQKIAEISIKCVEKHPWLISYFGMEEKVKKLYETISKHSEPKQYQNETHHHNDHKEERPNDSDGASNNSSKSQNVTNSLLANISNMSDNQIASIIFAMKSQYNCGRFLHIGTPIFNSKIVKAIKAYAKVSTNERPILMEDGTLFGSAKEGFVITNKRVYMKGLLSAAQNVAVSDISGVFCENKANMMYIFVAANNQKYELTYMSDFEEAQRCKNFIATLIEHIKLSNPVDASTWICQCGKNNTGKFCSRCGAKKIM